MKKFLIVFICLNSLLLIGQENFGIKIAQYQEDYDKFCTRFINIQSKNAKELAYGAKIDRNNIYFAFNDLKWFKSLFQNPYDGLATDIVTKNQYSCDTDKEFEQIRGTLLKPIYKNNLLKGIETLQKGQYRVKIGSLAPKFQIKEIEVNVSFLQSKCLCQYLNTYNLNSYDYDLLDMGMFLDSVSYNNSKRIDSLNNYAIKYKKMDFIIPFEKNKSTFLPLDIKPLYDSLSLTDFNIKKIDVKAYSSIEGSFASNAVLQEKRSNSIIEALQSFQKPTIETMVSTSENWVEFLNDIEDTEFDFLKTLSKNEIKRQITGDMALKMEKFLKNHRKALITLYLDKIDYYQEFSGEQLITAFNSAIAEENFMRASELQNALFDKLRKKEADPDVLNKMVIPRQRKFADFFNSNSAFRYENETNDMIKAYYEFQELKKWFPDNKKITYNLTALALRFNHKYQGSPIEPNVWKKIIALEVMGIDNKLIDRMKVNYHITHSAKLFRELKFDEKDKSVEFILNTYKNISLSALDYLSLAQYVTFYYDINTAIELLEPQVNKINIDKNLVFYYLNLTLIDDAFVERSEYLKIMLNAINLDKKRFCKLFNPSWKGGVTFQLLDNTFLKATYCENCKD